MSSKVAPSAALLALLGVVGTTVRCSLLATHLEPPAVSLEGRDPAASWRRVLARVVDAEGRIDFDALRADSEDLDVFVAWLQDHGPQSQPAAFASRAAALSHYINAYNALAMYAVLHAGVLPKETVSFFYWRRLRHDGESISLYALENDRIRPLGEPRIHFALNCMVRACPRLPQEPFTAERLEAQLDAAAREFFGRDLHVEVDAARRVARFSEILDFYPEDFLAVAPSLIDYANRYRDEPIPTDYAVEFVPYDWTLNAAR